MLEPLSKKRFTWDELVTDGDHILEVQIEGVRQFYNIDKLQDFLPI